MTMFRIRRTTAFVPLTAAAWLACGAAGSADDGRPAGLRDVGLEQRLNERVPLELGFRDEQNRSVRLGDYFGRTPVILTLNYFDCPMLCPLVLNDVLRAVRAVRLEPGTDFRVVSVSIDPRDTAEAAAAKQRWYIDRDGRPEAADGWHFLTGNEDSIASLAQAVGFRYARDPQSGQYAHTAGIMVLTSDGRLARYFYGLEYSPRDLRLALVEAGQGRIGTLADQVLLFCFHYDPASGRYSLVILNVVRAAGGATVLGLGILMAVLIRRERRDAPHPDRPLRGGHAL
jgi:protein SCO1/2